jgi:hypothetical protein
MDKESEDKSQCPWCEEFLSLREEEHQGSHTKMRIVRCSKCNGIISTRAEGEPDRIIQKALIEGDLP